MSLALIGSCGGFRMEGLSKNGWAQCCSRVARVSRFNLPEVRLLPADLVEDGGKELRF